jgi:hypothetical protein
MPRTQRSSKLNAQAIMAATYEAPRPAPKPRAAPRSSSAKRDEPKQDAELAAYYVEKLLGKRGKEGALEYKVKWQDFPEAESTWEPASALSSDLSDFDEHVAAFEKAAAAPAEKPAAAATGAAVATADPEAERKDPESKAVASKSLEEVSPQSQSKLPKRPAKPASVGSERPNRDSKALARALIVVASAPDVGPSARIDDANYLAELEKHELVGASGLPGHSFEWVKSETRKSASYLARVISGSSTDCDVDLAQVPLDSKIKSGEVELLDPLPASGASEQELQSKLQHWLDTRFENAHHGASTTNSAVWHQGSSFPVQWFSPW